MRRLFLLLWLGTTAAAQIYAGNGCTATGGGGSISCTVSNVNAGQSIFVFVFDTYNTGGPGPSALADTGSYGAIASITGPTHPYSGGNWENLWVITNAGAGTHTLTATTPGAGAGSGIVAVAVSGASTGSPVDQYGAGYQNNNYTCTVSTAAAAPGELVLEFDDGTGTNAPTITGSQAMSRANLAAYANGLPNAYYGTAGAAGTISTSSSYGYNGYSVCDLVTVTPTAIALATTTASLPNGHLTQAYSQQLAARGGTLPYSSWSLSSGTLPAGLSLSSSGVISGTPSAQGTYSGLSFAVTDSAGNTVTTQSFSVVIGAAPISITTTSCPGGTQYQSYAGCAMTATGGTPPFTWTSSTAPAYDPIPEGLTVNSSTGGISSSYILGMGSYRADIIVTDSAGDTANQVINFAINGDTSYLTNPPFPGDSIWDQNVSGLPVDTSPAASALPGVHVQAVFGSNIDDGGIPVIKVPATQPYVTTNIASGGGPSMFTTGPWPQNAPIEGPTNCEQNGGNSDCHSLVVLLNSSGVPTAGYEMYQTTELSAASWQSASQGYYSFTSYGMYTQDNGEGTDAAGLPVAPLLANYDAVTSAQGQRTPLRATFNQNNMLARHVWPATAQAGGGATSGGYEDSNKLISQLNPPTSASSNRIPFGEIYRITAAAYASPPAACLTNFTTNPEAASIWRTLRNYGIIAADNGSSSFIGIIGTNDARWKDSDLACLNNIVGSDFDPVEVEQLAKDWPGTSTDLPDLGSSQVRPPVRKRVDGNASERGNIRLQ